MCWSPGCLPKWQAARRNNIIRDKINTTAHWQDPDPEPLQPSACAHHGRAAERGALRVARRGPAHAATHTAARARRRATGAQDPQSDGDGSGMPRRRRAEHRGSRRRDAGARRGLGHRSRPAPRRHHRHHQAARQRQPLARRRRGGGPAVRTVCPPRARGSKPPSVCACHQGTPRTMSWHCLLQAATAKAATATATDPHCALNGPLLTESDAASRVSAFCRPRPAQGVRGALETMSKILEGDAASRQPLLITGLAACGKSTLPPS